MAGSEHSHSLPISIEPPASACIKPPSRTHAEEIMTAGPLHPDNLTGGRDRSLGKGHGTAALGPSDSSDSGSDLHGAPGLARQIDGFGLTRPGGGDIEESFANYTAGPDVG